MYTWGSSSKILLWGSYVGARHSLGRANTDKNLQPLPLDIDEKVIDIKSGRNHCLALSETSIYAWGLNDYGELGSEEIVHFNETPLKIKFFSELNEKIIKIEAGGYSSAALTASGKLYVWGSNQEKNLAMGDSFQFFNTPTLVPFSLHHPVKEVSLGSNTMMVMTQDDEIYATGMEFSTEFEKFNFNLPGKAESIFCGRNYLGVLDSEGNLAHFGGPFNSHHDLGVLDSARVMAKEVFPGKLKKVVGKFELVAGVSASECD